MKNKRFEGLPDIEDYLSSKGNGHPISVHELDHIQNTLIAYCGFTKEQSQRFLSLFFQEIRSSILKGEVVDIRGLGSFFVSSPETTLNSKKVFVKFKLKKSFIKRLRDEFTRKQTNV